jgi:hypothetical protein
MLPMRACVIQPVRTSVYPIKAMKDFGTCTEVIKSRERLEYRDPDGGSADDWPAGSFLVIGDAALELVDH